MKILVINGPNLGLLGVREPEIYGYTTLADVEKNLQKIADEEKCTLEFLQSNHEGVIVDRLNAILTDAPVDGIVINPAAYTHTSVAIHDCLEAISIPKVEVHLSDVNNREEYRKVNFVTDVCNKTFSGKKEISYLEAVGYLKNIVNVI